MMREGKDEARVMMSPMFPRLRVNDTEKGGPRAPPRNKMALYEHLSTPSQSFNSGSLSMLPLPPNNNNNMVPPISSSSPGGGNERSMFMPFYNSHQSSILADKFHSYSIPGTTMKGNQERKSTKVADYSSLDTTPPIPVVSNSNPFQPLHFSNFKKFSLNKLRCDDDLRVPTSFPSGIDQNCSCSNQSEGGESFSELNLGSSMQLQTVKGKEVKGSDSVDSKSRRYVENQAEENGRLFDNRQDLMERPNSTLSTRDKILADTSSDLPTKIKNLESLKRQHASYNQGNKSSSVDILNGKDGPNARLHHEYAATKDKMIFWENILVESDRCLENASKVGSESCSRESLGVDNESSNALENSRKAVEEKKCGTMQVGAVSGHNNAPGASMVESVSPLDICPDDVVRIIGEKHFWKVRTAIVNQQRVFAVQVFELHRLIKVQRLIAGSPHMLREETLHMAKPSLDVSPYVPEPPLFFKVKDNYQKSNISIKCADQNAVAKLPLPSSIDDTSEGLVAHRPKYVAYSGNAWSMPMADNTWPSPYCFSQPGNQWLVPVMSPSEGLVYKPYTGHCPPTGGFLAPVYGNCYPVNVAAGGGDFPNTAYELPASSQLGLGVLPGNPPIGQTYFLHYGMPVRNPSVSGSAVKQVGPFTGVRSKDNQFSTGDVNFTAAHQSSRNMSSQMSQAISYRAGKLLALEDSEIQGSTASSPSERAKGDALPLFPSEPTTRASNHDGPRTRVIKVVPHNPRLATESAARIFRSIQEGRKQCH